MNEFQTYETIIRQRATGRLLWQRIGLVFFYLFWVSLCYLFFVLVSPSAAVLILTPLTTFVWVLLTWKYVMIEYEYIISGGIFSLTKIYGKKKRKPMLEAEIKQALLIAPYTEEYAKQAERLSPEEIHFAASDLSEESVWLFAFRDEDEEKTVLFFFEAEERSIALLRRQNPRAVAKISR